MDITWASLEWMRPCAASNGHEWLVIHVTPIKDSKARATPVPTPIRRCQHGGARGADALCVYDALCAVWDDRVHTVPQRERTRGSPSGTPLFTSADEASA
eukprot:6181923-Pleurochrysis_carterae.AAC.2